MTNTARQPNRDSSLHIGTGRRREASRREFRRRFQFERLESRELLAGDIQLRFDILDGAGTPVASVQVGSEFTLEVYVQDLRNPAAGVTSAFLDVTYDDSLAAPSGDVTHGVEYGFIADGSLDTPGLIDEAGGAASNFPAPRDPDAEYLLFRVPFVAEELGTLVFAPDAADKYESIILVYGKNDRLAFEDMEITGNFFVEIVEQDEVTTESRTPWQNPENALDVNTDGSVTLLDLMLVLDGIDSDGMRVLPNPPTPMDTPNPTPDIPGTNRYLDVNGDGGVSLQDAQAIADFLNASSPLMASSAAVLAAAKPVPDSLETLTDDVLSIGPLPLLACQVQVAHSEALRRFRMAGAEQETLSLMSNVTVVIADLPAGQLGAASAAQLTIDVDGDGRGWYVDPTPEAEEEFVAGRSCYVANLEEDPQGRYDLLTVVAHELAHVAGLSDILGPSQWDDLMYHALSPGQRRMPDASVVDRIFAQEVA